MFDRYLQCNQNPCLTATVLFRSKVESYDESLEEHNAIRYALYRFSAKQPNTRHAPASEHAFILLSTRAAKTGYMSK